MSNLSTEQKKMQGMILGLSHCADLVTSLYAAGAKPIRITGWIDDDPPMDIQVHKHCEFRDWCRANGCEPKVEEWTGTREIYPWIVSAIVDGVKISCLMTEKERVEFETL